jgi:ABC-type Fe3+-siderophore transport system permease subunit
MTYIWDRTVVAYALPFSIIICYFSRYRRPVEPLVMVLVGISIASLAQHLVRRFRLTGVKPADQK